MKFSQETDSMQRRGDEKRIFTEGNQGNQDFAEPGKNISVFFARCRFSFPIS
jgi:hypothetical protein